jgi:hypothetical protein
MPRKSTGKPKTPDVIPAFETEAEEADWWASPASATRRDGSKR